MEKKRWYIVQTYSGFENSVKQDIERRTESMQMQDYIFQILIPEEIVEETKSDGTKKQVVRKMFPGYVFIEMIVTDDSWFIVRNTQKVTGFLGSSGNGTKPVRLPPDEINSILRKMGKLEKPSSSYNVGEKVLVLNGPWKDKVVEIAAINDEKETVTVLIELFGRYTPTELSFTQVSKLN